MLTRVLIWKRRLILDNVFRVNIQFFTRYVPCCVVRTLPFGWMGALTNGVNELPGSKCTVCDVRLTGSMALLRVSGQCPIECLLLPA